MELSTAPQRVIDDLQELRYRTSTDDGAQRLAWSETWDTAREYLRQRLAELPVRTDIDEAGNLWSILEGDSPEMIILGSHLDSVPDGGWLDGAYGVMAGLEILRAMAEQRSRPVTLALVDWADEEGARFGRSLFSSSAAVDSLELETVRDLTDSHGNRLTDVLDQYGIDLESMKQAKERFAHAQAYLELHIEQGPVLEQENLPIGVVQGTVGIQRHKVTFEGVSAHAGSTPMDRRHDPVVAAARTVDSVRAAAIRHQGVGTVGSVVTQPGIVTATAERATLLLDLRHLDASALTAMLEEVQTSASEFANAEGCTTCWEPLFTRSPQPFDDEMVDLARQVCKKVTGTAFELPSGALHDATSIAPIVPTAMLFTSCIGGLSHNRDEDASHDDLRTGVEALASLTSMVLDRVVEKQLPTRAP